MKWALVYWALLTLLLGAQVVLYVWWHTEIKEDDFDRCNIPVGPDGGRQSMHIVAGLWFGTQLLLLLLVEWMVARSGQPQVRVVLSATAAASRLVRLGPFVRAALLAFWLTARFHATSHWWVAEFFLVLLLLWLCVETVPFVRANSSPRGEGLTVLSASVMLLMLLHVGLVLGLLVWGVDC